MLGLGYCTSIHCLRSGILTKSKNPFLIQGNRQVPASHPQPSAGLLADLPKYANLHGVKVRVLHILYVLMLIAFTLATK